MTPEERAEAAWLVYREHYAFVNRLSPRRAARQMRKREFFAGYQAALGIDVTAARVRARVAAEYRGQVWGQQADPTNRKEQP